MCNSDDPTTDSNNDFAGQNTDAGSQRPKRNQSAFSAETFANFSPGTAANFQNQSYTPGPNAETNAAANDAFNAGAAIANQNANNNFQAQQDWAASGGYTHGGPGSPMDPNWDDYSVGHQLQHMAKSIGGTFADIGVGMFNAYSNTIGSAGAVMSNAAFGTEGTTLGRETPHWSDGFFSDPDGFMGPNDSEAATYGGAVDSDIENGNTAPITPVSVEEIEPMFLGGMIEKGKAYLVGEQGPELLMTGENGKGEIIPNPATVQNNNVVPMPVKKPTHGDRFLGDFSFIQELEGTKSIGYVPTEKGEVLGKSGVTIASGFDLGQRKNADLAGLPPELIAKMQPYLGVKGKDALNLDYKNLNLTDEEVLTVNKFAKNEALSKLNKSFEATTGESFYGLPEAAQTVIASVAFQHGDLKSKTPNFWKQITNGDWNGAIANLEDWDGTGKDSTYQTRRKKEANLLRKMRPVEQKIAALDEVAKKYGFN